MPKTNSALPTELHLPVFDDLCLRLLQRSDSSEFFEMVDRNRCELRQWLSWVDEVLSVEDIAARSEACLRSNAEGKSLRFFITHQGAIIGMLAAMRIDWDLKLAQLSFCLEPQYRGRGFTTRCCAALIDYMAREFNIENFRIRIARGNVQSASVAERLGFQLEGTEKRAELLRGQWLDHSVYAYNFADTAENALPTEEGRAAL